MDLFRSHVPYRPYCSDDLTQGVRIRDKEKALSMRYIQVNPPSNVGYLVFDVDREGAAIAWEQRNLPAPSWIAINPANGHAHLVYRIATPVVKTDAARLKPLRFLAAVQYSMTQALGADPNYAHFLTKNPLNPSWRVVSYDGAVYDLQTLSEYVELKTPQRKREALGEGRNCSLFDTLRQRAYREVNAFREGGCYDTFARSILDTARRLNTFRVPLPDSEVKATAKSIARWTWRHFGTGAALEGFKNRQKARQKRSAMARKGATSAAIVRAVEGLQKAGKPVTVSAVARLAGVSRPTVYRRRSLLTATVITPPAEQIQETVTLAKSDNSAPGAALAAPCYL